MDDIVYGFDLSDAQSLKYLAKKMQGQGGDLGKNLPGILPDGNNKIIAMTPAGGIPARAADVAGMAQCDQYGIGPDGDLVDLETPTQVFNIFGSDIAGDVYILASFCGGKYLADAEDCG